MKHRFAALAVLAFAGACSPAGQSAQHETDATATSQSTASAAVASTNEAPPMEHGLYISHELCSGEGGCPWKHWRATAAVPVRAQSDASSPVIATLATGAWVEALDGLSRFVPKRGVVRTADQGLEVGDVIYLLDSEGEGDFMIWRRGATRSWHWPDDPAQEAYIEWDAVAPIDDPRLGWWVRVKLADGRIGWVSNPRFECMGPLAGDEGCRG